MIFNLFSSNSLLRFSPSEIMFLSVERYIMFNVFVINVEHNVEALVSKMKGCLS